MKTSNVVDHITGKTFESKVRTSTGHFLQREQDAVVARIEERIAAFAMIPVDHGEGMQVLHYGEGQKYEPHFDYFKDHENTKHGGQRVATVLLYLSDVEQGGETIFPKGKFVMGEPGTAGADHEAASRQPGVSSCARGKLHVKPRRGDALLFWNTMMNGHEDDMSLHGGCPVIKGNKWTATKWMRVGPYGSKKEIEIRAKMEERRKLGKPVVEK